MIDHSLLPARVSTVAEMVGVSPSTVYRAVKAGYLEADEDAEPLLIVGGDMPVTKSRFKAELSVACSRLRKGTWGFNADGDLEILRGCELLRYAFTDAANVLRSHVSNVEAMAE